MRRNEKQKAVETSGWIPRPAAAAAQGRAGVSVAIVTMTLARTDDEARLLEQSLRAVSKLGLPIYVGEGGSDKQFVERLASLPRLEICPRPSFSKPGLVSQLRAAFGRAEASQPDYVIYTEPDKLAFFAKGLPALLQGAYSRGPGWTGLVLAARTPRAFATFPEGQKVAENFMNQFCGEALGQPGDYTYGPMLISRGLLRFTQLVPDNLGWGWRFFLMAVAHQLRMNVELCPVGSPCPRSQRNEDDAKARDYRLRQLVQNVTGLANGWTCLLDHPLEEIPVVGAAA